jgi:hypothetical protein
MYGITLQNDNTKTKTKMKWIAIKILECRIKRARKEINDEPYSVFSGAKKRMVENYRTSIMFLKAEMNRDKSKKDGKKN